MTLATALLAFALLAQPAEPSITFQARAVPREQRAPVVYESDHVIVFKAMIADREVWAVLDTGSQVSLMDVSLAREAGLTVRPRDGKAHSPSGEIPTWEVSDVPIVLPGQFETRHPAMPAIDLSTMPGVDGRKVGFVLGRDFVRVLVLLVDPGLRTFQFAPPGAFRPPPGAPALDLTPGSAQITASLEGQPVRLNIDTGFRGDLSLTPAAWDRLVPKNAAVQNSAAQDVVGRSRPTREAQRPGFVLGPIRVASVKVLDRPAILSSADGEVGMGVFSRFRFALDMTAGKLWITPLVERPAAAK